MANYTNLASLVGLTTGDVVTYNSSFLDGYIDFKGAVVSIAMSGVKNGGSKGGAVAFTIDTSSLPNNFYFRADRPCLAYCHTGFNLTDIEYYRIAVPGDSGYNGGAANGGGGGITSLDTSGAAGGGKASGSCTGGKAAKINAGGEAGVGYEGVATGTDGSFGEAGNPYGGYGWYGGGAGAYVDSSLTNCTGGGGGTGFVLTSNDGLDTRTYIPSGYMNNDSTMISTIANAVSGASSARAASSLTGTGEMTVTVISAPTITGIAVTQNPTKTTYVVGDTFDSTGLVVSAVYSNSSTAALSSNEYTLSTPDMSTTGTKTITVTYTDSNTQNTYTTTFNIAVKNPPYPNYYKSIASGSTVSMHVKTGDYILFVQKRNYGNVITVNNAYPTSMGAYYGSTPSSSMDSSRGCTYYKWGPATQEEDVEIKHSNSSSYVSAIRLQSEPTLVWNYNIKEKTQYYTFSSLNSSLYYAICGWGEFTPTDSYNANKLQYINNDSNNGYGDILIPAGTSGSVTLYNTDYSSSGNNSNSFVVALISCATSIPGPEYYDTELDSIAVTTLPTKTTYALNETFDPTGLVVTATYTDSSTAVLSSNDYTLSTPDMSTSGVKTITVTYTEDGVTATTTFNITVIAPLTGISVTSEPYKLNYAVNDTFDPTGLVVVAEYSDSSTSTLTSNDYTLSSPDMTTTGTKAITVSYTENGITETTSFNITVYTNIVSSLLLSNAPTEFAIHQPFSYTGLIVTAVYTDGTSAPTNDFSVTNVDTDLIGTKPVTVIYTGVNKNGNVFATYNITVSGYKNLASLEGLFSGDSIEYYGTPSSTFTDIDFKNWKVSIKMEGARNQSAGGKGGLVQFEMDTNGLDHFRFRNEKTCLVYKSNFNTEYYRIAVPGDTGYPATDGTSVLGNAGSGGLQAGFTGNAGNGVTSGGTRGNGASISAPGTGVSETDQYSTYGSFGQGGAGICSNPSDIPPIHSSSRAGRGGYGWYGGSGGYITDASSQYASGGGGSSFVLSDGSDGVSVDTTQYIPSGYMGNDSTLIANLASKISYTSTSRSQSSMSNGDGGKMTVTLLSKNIERIYNIVYPTKRTYAYGEITSVDDIDLSGASATVEFSDGEISTLHDWNFFVDHYAPWDISSGNYTIYLKVQGYNSTANSYSYTIYINPENTVLVNSLTISGNYQTTFDVGDTFNTTNLVVTANYSDGTSAALTTNDYTVSSPNMNTAGTQTVTITYNGLNTSGPVTASYDITINSLAALRYYDNTTQTFVPCEVYYCAGVVPGLYVTNPGDWQDNVPDGVTTWTCSGRADDLPYDEDDSVYSGYTGEISFGYNGTVRAGTYAVTYDFDADDYDDYDLEYKLPGGNWTEVTGQDTITIPNDLVNPTIYFRGYAEFSRSDYDADWEFTLPVDPLDIQVPDMELCEVYIYDGTEFKKSQG